MGRRRGGLVDALIEISSSHHWCVGILFGIGGYLFFHAVANTTASVGLVAGGIPDLPALASNTFFTVIAFGLQYIFLFCGLCGALIAGTKGQHGKFNPLVFFGSLAVMLLIYWITVGRSTTLPTLHDTYQMVPHTSLIPSMPNVPNPAAPTMPDGKPWSIKSGYVEGYAIEAWGSNCALNVSNAWNNSAVYSKLVSFAGQYPRAVRVFQIPPHDSFVLWHVQPGTYQLYTYERTSGHMIATDIRTISVDDQGKPRSALWNLNAAIGKEISLQQFERGPE